MKKNGQIGVDDAWKGHHLVNLLKLVDQWEGPFLTLSSQKRPTLSRMRRGNVEKEWLMRQACLDLVDTRCGVLVKNQI
jgi:hypothetical protein